MAEQTTTNNNESWLRWVALATTLFAVSAAISTIKSGGFSSRITIMTTLEANQWSYFQSKSIKQHSTEMQLDLFRLKAAGPMTAGERKFLAEKMRVYEGEVARYDKEKAEIKAVAEKTGADRDGLKEHSGRLGLAIMYLQLAIMLSSMSSLLKQRPLFMAGVAMGIIGVSTLVYGIYF
jgi:predicted phage tail protein